MAIVNQHGLNRYIPVAIRRDVRQRSKFGCVVCRSGFYQYEHIDPLFKNALKHDPECICCLCGSCHDLVTRGRLSKKSIMTSYHKIQTQQQSEVSQPIGPLDFHDGSAELMIGSLLYSPAVQTVLRYHGKDLIQVVPGKLGEPGKISAVFTDETGRHVLQLVENEWIGSTDNWDIEVVGQQLTVRRASREISLQLRLDPPGRIVVEYLDMRVGDGHVLATEKTYAVGRYSSDGTLHWAHVSIQIQKNSPNGAAIEFTDAKTLEARDVQFKGTGQELYTDDRQIVLNSNVGVMIKPFGIVIASLCGSFAINGDIATGSQPLDDMRSVIRKHPDELCRFISTGKVEE